MLAPDCDLDARLRSEAERLFDRYTREVVEGFGLCPWAAPTRQRGELRVQVVLEAVPDAVALGALIDAIAADAAVVIGIVLLPRMDVDAGGFRRFARGLAADHATRGGGRPVMAIADFHPSAICDDGSAARLVPWLRRTPDPTLQLVRLATLAEHRPASMMPALAVQAAALVGVAAPPPIAIADRIAAANLVTFVRAGVRLDAVIEDIQRDRARSYAGLIDPPAVTPAAHQEIG